MDGNDIDDIKRLLERRNSEIKIIEKVASKINKSLDIDAIANTIRRVCTSTSTLNTP